MNSKFKIKIFKRIYIKIIEIKSLNKYFLDFNIIIIFYYFN